MHLEVLTSVMQYLEKPPSKSLFWEKIFTSLKFSLILITEEAPQHCDVVRPAADIEDQYTCIIPASFLRSGETKGATSSKEHTARAFPKDFTCCYFSSY